MKTLSVKRIIAFTYAVFIISTMLLISGCANNEAEIQTMKIETPFAQLEYPAKWEGKISTEWVGNDEVGTMIFSLKGDYAMNVELFQVHFNEDAQIPAGILKVEDGSEVRVGISLSEFDFGDSWTDSEKDEFYAMQEDANFIISRLSKQRNYKSE